MSISGCIKLAAVGLLVGGLSACAGLEESLDSEEANDTPRAVKEGKPFKHDYMSVAGGWKVKNERFAGLTIKNLKATNNSDERQTPQLTFRFYKGSNVLGEVECTANQVGKGETTGFDCFSLDQKPPKNWKTIKVSDMW